jgi:peroxiredoxin
MRSARRLLLPLLLPLLLGCPARQPVERVDLRRELARLPSVPATPWQPGALRDRAVLVFFGASWCFPCLAELERLKELQTRWGERGLSVVMVGMDLEGAMALDPLARQYEVNFPVLVADERLLAGESTFGRISALPSTVVLDRQGDPVAAWEGVADSERLEALIAKVVR